MVLNFGNDDDLDSFELFTKNESIPEGVFTRLRERRQIYGVPNATAKRVMKTLSDLSSISKSSFFFPNKGLLKFKYAIDYNLNNDVSEWNNEDGMIMDNLVNDVLLKADGGNFPAMFVITSQQDLLNGETFEGPPGGDPFTLITDANFEAAIVDLEAPLSDSVVMTLNLDSIITINSFWIKARVDIYAGAGITEIKFQTSENNVDWTTHQTTSSNVDFTLTKNLLDLTFRYARILMTAATNDQHLYVNMVGWSD